METTATERRLAAILAADVVGYSRLVEKDEAGTLAALRKLRAEIIDPLIARHKGRIVKLMGDGAIVEFGSVVDAVSCAVAVQKDVAAAQTEVAADQRVVFRIGVNLGDVVVEGDDLLGDGVNVAARIEQLCDPGGVLLSGTAYDQLRGKLGLPMDFSGEQRIKNIAEPVRTYRVRMSGGRIPWRLRFRQHRRGALRAAAALVVLALIGGGVWWFRPVESAAASSSIAVLPFDNLGSDEATGRLADGITEDIITDLARFRDLVVIARNSVEVYRDKAVDIRQVGRDLNVRYVLEGSIQRQQDRFRVTAQLIDADSGAHVWSERWDRPAEDIFAVQAEVAERIATSFGGYGLIAEAERSMARRKAPGNLTAYELYLLGVEATHRLTQDSLDEAIRMLKQAIDLDPQLARAWTALSWAYKQSADIAPDPRELRGAALDAARRAVELDPVDAEAHVALGHAAGKFGDLKQAEAEYERALQLNPNHAVVLNVYAAWASGFGEPEKGAQIAGRVIRLDPGYPIWAVGGFSYAFFMAGRYEDALRVLARKPDVARKGEDFIVEAGSLAGLGRVEEAKAAVARAMTRFPDISVEAQVGLPEFIEHERQRFAETMRKAGFPVCANENVLKAFPDLVRMPECIKAASN